MTGFTEQMLNEFRICNLETGNKTLMCYANSAYDLDPPIVSLLVNSDTF